MESFERAGKPKSYQENVDAIRTSTLELMQKCDETIKDTLGKIEKINTTLNEAEGNHVDITMLKNQRAALEGQLDNQRKRREGFKKDLSDLGFFVK